MKLFLAVLRKIETPLHYVVESSRSDTCCILHRENYSMAGEHARSESLDACLGSA